MRYAILATLCALGVGCVPVTEPVGDIDKAEPDKALVGNWAGPKDTTDDYVRLRIDVPEVKGNPKGLMRAIESGNTESAIWFFTTTIGKHTYATTLLKLSPDSPKGGPDFAQFAKEDAFATWRKLDTKHFFICQYTLDGDKLTLDWGNEKAATKVMADAKITRDDDNGFFKTPAGWFAKYLDKTGPTTIFDGQDADKNKYRRLKKK